MFLENRIGQSIDKHGRVKVVSGCAEEMTFVFIYK